MSNDKILFEELNLPTPILSAITELGFVEPTPIQQQSIPALLAGKDVLGEAQTGTGKTAAFTLPILSMFENSKPATSNNVKALILTPTRELAAQINDNISFYGKHLNLKTQVVFGGVGINPQMQKYSSPIHRKVKFTQIFAFHPYIF